MKRLCIAILSLLLAKPVASEAIDPGRALFEGLPNAPGYAVIGSDKVTAERFPCRSCHRGDGRGGGEGDAPPIAWEVLTRATSTRPAYDARALARLLATGEMPSGEQISRLMPRYELDDPVVTALISHLSGLTAEQKTGIHSDRIVFGVPVQKDHASGGSVLVEALNAALAGKMPPNGLYGRRIEIRPLVGTPEEILARARDEAVAILSPLQSGGTDMTMFTDAGIPVLFPIGAATDRADPGLVRSLYASRERATDLLLQKASSDGCRNIAPLQASRKSATELHGLHPGPMQAEASGAEAPRECLVIAGGRVTHQTRGRPSAIYILANDIPEFEPVLEGYRGAVIVGRHETPAMNLAATKSIAPIQAHAMLIAEVLYDALLEAGRDLTRTNLVSKIGSVSRPELGLDFSQSSVSGSSAVTFQEIAVGGE